MSKVSDEQVEAGQALRWALDEIDTLSNKLCAFAYPQGMQFVRRSEQVDAYDHAVRARAALEAVSSIHDAEAVAWVTADILAAMKRGDTAVPGWKYSADFCIPLYAHPLASGVGVQTWEENVEAMLSSGDPDVIRCHEGGGPEDLIGSLVLTVMRTRNARDSAIAKAGSQS